MVLQLRLAQIKEQIRLLRRDCLLATIEEVITSRSVYKACGCVYFCSYSLSIAQIRSGFYSRTTCFQRAKSSLHPGQQMCCCSIVQLLEYAFCCSSLLQHSGHGLGLNGPCIKQQPSLHRMQEARSLAPKLAPKQTRHHVSLEEANCLLRNQNVRLDFTAWGCGSWDL